VGAPSAWVCVQLRMTSGSTISVVAVEVLEQARQLQLEKQVEMASQEAKVKPAQLPKRAAKKQVNHLEVMASADGAQ
jgi:hypothetical protein